MDIFSYVENKGKLEVQSFLVLKGIIQILLARSTGYVTTEDFKNGPISSQLGFQFTSTVDMMAHLNVVVQACFYPILSTDFDIRLYPLDSVRGTDKEYLLAVSSYINNLENKHMPPNLENAFSAFRKAVSIHIVKSSESQMAGRIGILGKENMSENVCSQHVFTPSPPPSNIKSQDETAQHSLFMESVGSQIVFTPPPPSSSIQSQSVPAQHSLLLGHQPQSYKPPLPLMAPQLNPYTVIREARRESMQQSTDGFSLVQKKSAAREKDNVRDRDNNRERERSHGADRFESLRSTALKPVRLMSNEMSNFSSAMRKNGMDFILCSALYDKVLCSIFLASSITVPGESYKTAYPERSHKEIVDIVMYLQDSGYLGKDDATPLSKTKLRGVLGLLKNADILSVQHDGDSVILPSSSSSDGIVKEVKLVMNNRIRSFEDFRHMHDSYIPDCIRNLQLILSAEDLKLIRWTADDSQQKLTRASCYIGLIRQLVKTQLSQFHPHDNAVNISQGTKTRALSGDDWEELSKQIEESLALPSPAKTSILRESENILSDSSPSWLGALDGLGGSIKHGPPIVPYSTHQYCEEQKDEHVDVLEGFKQDSSGDNVHNNTNNTEIEQLSSALMKK